MEGSHTVVTLNHLERRLRFPLRLSYAGWLPFNPGCVDKTPRKEFTVGFNLRYYGTRIVMHRECADPGVAVVPRQSFFACCRAGEVSWAEHDGCWDEIYFCYPAEAEQVFDAWGISGAPRLRFFSLTPRFRALARELYAWLPRAAKPGGADRLDLIASQLICEAHLPGPVEESPEIDHDSLSRIVGFFHDHFTGNFKLGAVLRRFGMSERSFYREWAKRFPVSPAAYLLELRLRYACQLLAAPGESAERVAAAVGFSGPAAFSRSFKRRFGVSPCRWRRDGRSC